MAVRIVSQVQVAMKPFLQHQIIRVLYRRKTRRRRLVRRPIRRAPLTKNAPLRAVCSSALVTQVV